MLRFFPSIATFYTGDMERVAFIPFPAALFANGFVNGMIALGFGGFVIFPIADRNAQAVG